MKNTLFELVDSIKDELFELNSYIYHNPETAFAEYKACSALVAILKKHGFQVEEKAAGLDTAFVATVCPTGEAYPCIDVLAEYDALGLGDSYGAEYTVAHACGHNIIATSAAGAAIALKRLMEDQKIPGTLRMVGTPAEEGGGGKIIMQRAGVFDHTDAMIMIHPTSGTTKIAGRCKCSSKFRIKYIGKSAHAGNHKERGINAQDAANICYTSVGCLRFQLPDEVQVFSLFTSCSEDRAIIPDLMQMTIAICSFSMKNLRETMDKVRNCIHAGAVATGCEVEIQESIGYQGRVCNYTLADVLRKNVELLGEPLMDGMVDDNGGEDFGNLNRVIPGVMLYPTLLPERKISNHTPEFYKLCNSDKAREQVLFGSRAMAYTMLDLFENTDIIDKAKEELRNKNDD